MRSHLFGRFDITAVIYAKEKKIEKLQASSSKLCFGSKNSDS